LIVSQPIFMVQVCADASTAPMAQIISAAAAVRVTNAAETDIGELPEVLLTMTPFGAQPARAVKLILPHL
jgi:hypothetical protein